MSMNVFVRDLDLGPFNHLDGRRLEVVADGLSLFGGAQLAIDTNLVSPLRRGKTTEWFTCMGGAARCLMNVVCCGSAVGPVGGPPAQSGVQILGGTQQFQDNRYA